MQIKSTKGVSPEFKGFMISLQNWIDEGCKENQPFSNTDSVCVSK